MASWQVQTVSFKECSFGKHFNATLNWINTFWILDSWIRKHHGFPQALETWKPLLVKPRVLGPVFASTVSWFGKCRCERDTGWLFLLDQEDLVDTTRIYTRIVAIVVLSRHLFTIYHGKSPLINHHWGECFLTFRPFEANLTSSKLVMLDCFVHQILPHIGL